MSFAKRLIIRKMWSEHCTKMQEMKATSWQLLSHPEITPDMLTRVHIAAVALAQRDREIRKLLREHGFDV